MTETFESAQNLELKPHPWIENFVGVLLSPVVTMRELAILNEHRLTGFGGAALAVILPCALDGWRMAPPSNFVLAALTVPTSIVFGLMMWATLAGLLSLTGWVFKAPPKHTRRVFVLTGWSFAPWILMAPVYCYREALDGMFGLFAILPLLWMFLLEMLAVKEAFELKSTQLLLLVFAVPALFFLHQMLLAMQTVYISTSALL